MTTNIRISVTGGELLKTAQEKQAANRSDQLQKEADSDFLKAVRRAEETLLLAEQAAQRFSEGGVLEYGFREETSAQRKGESFGIGWIYETYTDAVEHAWADKERFRIAVGSGDGTSWDYLELSQEIPADKPPISLMGFYEFDNTGVYVDNVQFTFPAAPNNEGGCVGSLTITHERYAQWQREYNLQRQNVKFIVPIGGSPDAGCILVGCARIKGQMVKQYSSIPVGSIVGLDGLYNEVVGGLFPTSASLIEITTVNNPGLGTIKRYATKLVENGAASTFCFYDSPYNYSGFNGTPTSNYGEPSYTYAYRNGFTPPPNEMLFDKTTRVNYAFFVSSNRCRRLAVTDKLNDLLNVWLQSDDDAAWTEAENTSKNGPAWGLVTDDGYIGPTLYGSPGIYDIIKNNFNFSLFDFDGPMFDNPGYLVSEVTKNIPITAPDFTSPESAFSLAARIEAAGQSTVVSYQPPPDYTSASAQLQLNTYIYLTPEQRASSAYYSGSSVKTLLSETANDPVFWLWQKKQNPGGLKQNTETSLPTFLPNGTYRTAAKLPLAPLRVLPPALFNALDTEHPLIFPQIVRSPSGLTYFANIFNPDPILGHAWSDYKLTTMLWTDWGAGRQKATLSLLGISLAPYSQ